MYTIAKKEDVAYWKSIEKKYASQCDEMQRLSEQLQVENDLIRVLQNKLNGTGAVVFCIKKDRLQNDSYICVQDHRSPHYDTNSGDFHLNGDLNIFVLSKEIRPSRISERYVDMPYLQARFDGPHIVIDEIHCDHRGYEYENKGYATMMIDALKEIAKRSNCVSISGKLSPVDAKSEKQKQKRNEFYKYNGFTLEFDDEESKSGRFFFNLGE